MDVRDAFFNEVIKFASKDKNLVFLTADMGALALEDFQKQFPERFINVGIAEQNLIGIATGMALAGKKVYAYGIASFIVYRAYDQIRCDICEMNLSVTIVGAGPGLSYGSDGPSHHCVHDIPLMSQLPNMIILTPRNAEEAIEAAQITYKSKFPTYVRLSKGNMPAQYGKYKDLNYNIPFILKGESSVMD